MSIVLHGWKMWTMVYENGSLPRGPPSSAIDVIDGGTWTARREERWIHPVEEFLFGKRKQDSFGSRNLRIEPSRTGVCGRGILGAPFVDIRNRCDRSKWRKCSSTMQRRTRARARRIWFLLVFVGTTAIFLMCLALLGMSMSSSEVQKRALEEVRLFTLPESIQRSLWELAYGELDGSEKSLEWTKDLSSTSRRLHSMCFGTTACEKPKLVYVRMPKSGNNEIRCNILSHPGFSMDPFHEWENVQRKNNKTDGVLDATCQFSFGLPYDRFTFVRNPESRFIAGYTEIEWRAREVTSYQSHFRFPIGDPRRFEEFVRHLLIGTDLDVKTLYHVYLQYGLSYHMNNITVGYLENMQTSWKKLQAKHHLPMQEFRPLCKHPTSADPLGTTAAAKRALLDRPHVQGALCILLLPDYLTFDYKLPSDCTARKTVKEAMGMVEKHFKLHTTSR